ncbi:zinc finger protein Xfin-like isoform X1 [Schistocerca americana]|uniref:zinc finger protein Xfin-like isoform X1 n=1 Tax=Schistocerca americana TaxID=7009 RepID=UPI001F4F2B7A|nr:zinc finger protein Xfin-like isoform X1 [Schistocerca americana]
MELQNCLTVAGVENVTTAQDPVVICLQPEGEVEWALPVITGSQQLDHEVVALVQEDVNGESVMGVGQIPAVNCVEVIPDFLGSVIPSCSEEGEKTVSANAVAFQEDDGQVFYITYTLPGTSEVDLTSGEPPVEVQGETANGEKTKAPHSVLHVAEDGSTVFLNVGHIINEADTALDSVGQVEISSNAANVCVEQMPELISKPSKKRFPSTKLQHSFVGNNLCIEDKLQIVDAMLTPAPKRIYKKKDKEEASANVKEVDLSYLCQFCGASFPEKEAYYNHLNEHTEEQKLSCTKSSGRLGPATSGGDQQREIGGHVVLRRYVCPQCPTAFSRLSQLANHQQHAHFGDRPHKCQICKKSFYKRSDLRSHLNIHLGISKSICEICGRKFNHVSNLIRHSRIHTGIKPYPCSICGRRFSQLNGMHQHKTIHQESRDISCSLCPKTFKSYNVMRRHVRYSHEDKLVSMGKDAYSALKLKDGTHVRSFYCKLCGASFKYAALLKHHESIHVQEKDFHCKFCKKDFLCADDVKTHYCGVNGDNTSPQIESNDDVEHEGQLNSNGIDVPSSRDIIIYVTEEGTSDVKQVRIKDTGIDHEYADIMTLPLSEDVSCVGHDTSFADGVVIVCKSDGEGVPCVRFLMEPSKDEKQKQKHENGVTLGEVASNTEEQQQQQQQEQEQEQLDPEIMIVETERKPEEREGSESHATEISMVQSSKLAEDISDLLTLDSSEHATQGQGKSKDKTKKNRKKKKLFSQYSQKVTAAKRRAIKDCININDMAEIVDEEDKNGIKTKRKMYKCPECFKKFNKNSNFKQHLGVHYMDFMKHSCPSCGQCFAWKSTLNKHILKMHSEAPQPKSSCEFCGREYPFAVQVQEHIKRDHLKQRPHVCPTCNKTFYKKHDLSVHRRTHTKEKPYICGTCSKSFSHLSHIIRHERIHNGVRPYKCPDCGREFIQSTSLKAHRQRHVAAAQKRELGDFNSVQEIMSEEFEDNNISAVPS